MYATLSPSQYLLTENKKTNEIFWCTFDLVYNDIISPNRLQLLQVNALSFWTRVPPEIIQRETMMTLQHICIKQMSSQYIIKTKSLDQPQNPFARLMLMHNALDQQVSVLYRQKTTALPYRLSKTGSHSSAQRDFRR